MKHIPIFGIIVCKMHVSKRIAPVPLLISTAFYWHVFPPYPYYSDNPIATKSTLVNRQSQRLETS